jgi:hypothetical protein
VEARNASAWESFLRREYGEIRQQVKRRTTTAAKQLEMAIKWRRSQDENKLLFEVVPIADEGLIDRAGKTPEQKSEEAE